MKKLFLLVMVCLFGALGVSGTTISGNLKTLGIANATGSNTFVRFTLQNYGSNIPTVNNTNVIVSDHQDFSPDSNGNISGSVQGNETITPSGTFYRVCVFYQGVQFECANYTITGSSWNLNSAMPLTSPASTPVTPTAISRVFQFTQSTAATTWTIAHNFGTTSVLVQFFDSNGKQIYPDTVTITDANTVTATFVVAQAGTATVMNSTNFSQLSNASSVVVTNPTANQAITGGFNLTNSTGQINDAGGTHSGTETFTGPVVVSGAASFTGTVTGLGTSTATNVVNTFTADQNIDANLHIKGPVPWIDVTRYGVRAVSSLPSTTATTTANSTSVTLASGTGFQNGDGITIYGAGAANAMTTPTGMTVTPAQAAAVTGSGRYVAAPAGSTTYGYKIVARDIGGGLTAASAEVTTTTGVASLGEQQITIASLSRSGQTVTVTTSTAHGLAQYAAIQIWGTSNDPGFGGTFVVNSVTNSTVFTYVDTRDGTFGASATGGTLYYYNCNKLALPNPGDGHTIQYYIYGRTAGSETLLGVSPVVDPATNNDPNRLIFLDFGSPMMDHVAFQSYVPTSPPASATADSLVTTISSGGGTTSVVVANAAGTSVTGAVALFDDVPTILAAATAASSSNATLYFPPAFNAYYYVNSMLTLGDGSHSYSVMQSGSLLLNDTVRLNGVKWYGDKLPPTGLSGQAGITAGQIPILVEAAHPGFYQWSLGNRFSGVNFQSSHNGYVYYEAVGGSLVGTVTFHDCVFAGSTNYVDYMGIGAYLTYVSGVSFYNTDFGYGSLSQTTGITTTPWVLMKNDTNIRFFDTQFNRRGIYADVVNGLIYDTNRDIEGPITPVVTLDASTQVESGVVTINGVQEDTSAYPVVWMVASYPSYQVNLSVDVGPGLGDSAWSGAAPLSLTTNLSNPGLGNVVSALSITSQNSVDGTVDAHYYSSSATTGIINDGPIEAASGWNIFSQDSPMAAPTCAISTGGSVSVGTYTFAISPVYPNNGEGTISPASASCSTTTGNQTITVNWTTVSGAIGYNVYWANNGSFPNLSNFSTNPNFTGGTTSQWVWSSGGQFTTHSATGPGTGSAALGRGYMQTPKITSSAYLTTNNCSSGASPAVCGSAAAGSFVIAVAATSVVVDTTAVTANSQILVIEDSSLGTKLGVTCNTSVLASPPEVTARTAATSFTVTTSSAPATNPACYSYLVVN